VQVAQAARADLADDAVDDEQLPDGGGARIASRSGRRKTRDPAIRLNDEA
jgi:hypothetical protein